MPQLTVRVEPGVAEATSAGARVVKPVQQVVQQGVDIPPPKPLALQLLAGLVLAGVIVLLVLALGDDPGDTAAALLGAGLFLCVVVVVLWVSSVFGLGLGPAQLVALLKAVGDVVKAGTKPAGDGQEPAPAPPQPDPEPHG
jgi:hypothetical protein